jgi:hypothetical protein
MAYFTSTQAANLLMRFISEEALTVMLTAFVFMSGFAHKGSLIGLLSRSLDELENWVKK